MSWTLAIDYGTTTTAAAGSVPWLPPGNQQPAAQAIELEGGPNYPSCALIESSGQIVVGQRAEASGASQPDRYIGTPKRLLAMPELIVAGRRYDVRDLVACTLRDVHQRAAQIRGGPPARIVLTHPARWGDDLMGRLLDAARLAGLPSPMLMSEPVAAAAWFTATAIPATDSLFGVFDLGGGTLDIAIVRVDHAGHRVVEASGGIDRLGGEDFDAALTAHMLSSPMIDEPTRDRLTFGRDHTDRMERRRFERAVKQGKELLSELELVLLRTSHGLPELQLTRVEHDSIVGPYIDRAVAELERLLAEARIPGERLNCLFLTGGACRAPIVWSRLRSRWPTLKLDMHDDPKGVTAAGAALLPGVANEPLSLITPPIPRPRRRLLVGLVAGLVVAGTGTAAAVIGRTEDGSSPGSRTVPDVPADSQAVVTEVPIPSTVPEAPANTEAVVTTEVSIVTEIPPAEVPETDAPGETDEPAGSGDVAGLHMRIPVLDEPSCEVSDPGDLPLDWIEQCVVTSPSSDAPVVVIGAILSPSIAPGDLLDFVTADPGVEVVADEPWGYGDADVGHTVVWSGPNGWCQVTVDYDTPYVSWICAADPVDVDAAWQAWA